MGEDHHSIGDSGGASQSNTTVGRDGRAELGHFLPDHGASAPSVRQGLTEDGEESR
jgi:hypothetical protein